MQTPAIQIALKVCRTLSLLDERDEFIATPDSFTILEIITELEQVTGLVASLDFPTSQFATPAAIGEWLQKNADANKIELKAPAGSPPKPSTNSAPAIPANTAAAGDSDERRALFSTSWRERRQPSCVADFRRANLTAFEKPGMVIAKMEGDTKRVGMLGFQVLNRMGLTWWLAAGTALGFHREGGFIPWDTDIDVEVLLDLPAVERIAIEKRLTDEFVKLGFEVSRTQHYVNGADRLPMQLRYTLDRIDFDVFLYYRDLDPLAHEWNYLYNYNDGGVMLVAPRFVEERVQVTFCDEKAFLPSPIENYLEFRYGKDWRIPVRKGQIWFNLAANLIRVR